MKAKVVLYVVEAKRDIGKKEWTPVAFASFCEKELAEDAMLVMKARYHDAKYRISIYGRTR